MQEMSKNHARKIRAWFLIKTMQANSARNVQNYA